MAEEVLDSFELNKDSFLQLLTKLIGETPHLQNNPPGSFILIILISFAESV
jgi:hypothetical protein